PPWKNTENFYYVKPGRWRTLIKFLLIDIILSCLNIPLSFPYLKEPITSCNIESLDSSEYEWCNILILCEKVYVILKSWVIYQYQYIKGLYLIWIRKEKLKRQSETEIEESKDLISKNVEDSDGNENAKFDINETNGFEIVTTK
ncbi:3240_t:CDS:2, partial [Dentiscutata heterogama]